MHITNIYSDEINTQWKDDETFLCMFDQNNNLVVYYDLCSGLRLVQDEEKMTVYINNSDLSPGKWIFFGTKTKVIGNNLIKEKIKIEGFSEYGTNHKFKKIRSQNKCTSQETVSEKEQKERISICNSCPFFDKNNMVCKENDRIVLDLTRYKYEYCPKEKWGNKEEVMKKLSENAIINIPQINQKEQQEFEKELEEYLKGL